MITIMWKTVLDQLQAFEGGKERKLAAGTFLFHQGDKVEQVVYVLAGEVRLLRHQADGSQLILQRAKANTLLAEASLYSPFYHCAALASVETQIYVVPRDVIHQYLQNDNAFAQALLSYLAREVQQARFRSELLSFKTVAARLDAWLNWHDMALPPKGEWKILAEQLAVSPEALYRELARRS